jgi:hypothetical protein
MKRCRECAGEVYGSDPVCTGCRTTEWLDMHNPARAREVFNQARITVRNATSPVYGME